MAILQKSEPIKAIVGHIMPGREGNYGTYHPTVFEGEGLPEGRIWKNLKPDEVSLLHKGMEVHLTPTSRNGRDTWDVILSNPEQTPSDRYQAKNEEHFSAETKKEIAAYSKEMINLYAYLWRESKAALEAQGCDDAETIRTCTSSTFIAAQRKFSLT